MGLRDCLACLALLPLLAEPARSPLQARSQLHLVEMASQEGFPLARPFLDRGTNRLRAAGVYLRVRDGAKLYALALYVDNRALAAQMKGKARTPEALAALLVEGKVAHAFVSRFVQPIPKENRTAFLLGNLKEAWHGPGFDPGSPTMTRFAAFFDRPLAKGAETQVWIDALGTIHTREAGGKPTATHDPAICAAFTASYLGARPMDPAMKTDLLRELPAVLEMEEMMGEKVGKGRK